MAENQDAPAYVVKVAEAGSKAVAVDVSDRFVSLEYEDDEKRADRLTLTLDNSDLALLDDPVWRKGNTVEVAWGFPGNMSPTFKCVIEKLRGGPDTFTIEAHGPAVLFDRVKKSRTFTNVTRSDVAKKIAEEYGYDEVTVEDTKAKRASVTQARMTDARFLRSMAKALGFEWWVGPDGFHFHGRKYDQEPVKAVTYHVDQGVGEVIEFSVESSTSGKAGKVEQKGRDPLTKKTFTASGDDATVKRTTLGKVIEVVDKKTGQTSLMTSVAREETDGTSEASEQEAKVTAAGKFKKHQNAHQLTIRLWGDPRIAAKRVLEVRGIGKVWSGRWYLTRVTHTLGREGYVVSAEARRDAHNGYPGKKGAQTTATVNDKKVADEGGRREVEVVNKVTGGTHVEWRK